MRVNGPVSSLTSRKPRIACLGKPANGQLSPTGTSRLKVPSCRTRQSEDYAQRQAFREAPNPSVSKYQGTDYALNSLQHCSCGPRL